MAGQLFLAGGGKENESKEVGGKFFEGIKKILYIPLAWPNDDFTSCLKWFKGVTSKFGDKEIDMLTDDIGNLMSYDGIFIGGGNTFKLLKRLREKNIDKKLIDYYKNGGKIFGSSAGAIIFGKSIGTALICKHKDKNEVNLQNLDGLNLIKNYDIQCHFEESQIEEHKQLIGDSDKMIICIPEGSALLIKNSQFSVIGSEPIILIGKKKHQKYFPKEIIEIY